MVLKLGYLQLKKINTFDSMLLELCGPKAAVALCQWLSHLPSLGPTTYYIFYAFPTRNVYGKGNITALMP